MKLFSSILFFGFIFSITPFNKLAAQTSEISSILIKPNLSKYNLVCSISYDPLLWKDKEVKNKMTGYYRPMTKSKINHSKTAPYYSTEYNNEFKVEGWKELVGGITTELLRAVLQ